MAEKPNSDASRPQQQEYMYNRNFHSAMRQNVNHFIMKGLTGWLLHPKVQYPRDAAVADVCCGTAIWLQEVAELLPPPARLTGFDVSSAMFPTSSWCLPHVTLMVQDAFKPFPAEQHEKYDVVHTRFLRCFVGDGDVEGLLRNLLSLLKPGGYLQWFDGLALRSSERTTNSAAPTTASQQLAAMSRQPNAQASCQWTERLDQLFEANGLEVAAAETVAFRDTYRHVWAMSTLAGIDDIRCKVDSDKAKNLQGLLSDVSNEVDQGVGMESPWTCVVGRKM